MLILSIESSCDETAAAVIDGRRDNVRVLSNVVASQIAIHQKYAGVVPEIAAREHILNILPVINEALVKAGLDLKTAPKKLDAIAITTGPGLITSLMTGIETAKTLAYVWKLPIVSVNHIAGHIYANWIESESRESLVVSQNSKFPALILTVSGGHNLLVLMKNHLKFKIIGDTLDDAAGEAFDKAAKMLGLGYPGGPAIAAAAAGVGRPGVCRDPEIKLPRPMLNAANFNFSFSGLKTALLYALKKDKDWQKKIPAYAAEFQQAVIDVLIHKTIKAAQKYKVKTVMLSGGVSSNLELQKQFIAAFKNSYAPSDIRYPKADFRTDNAAMIGAAGYFMARAKKFTKWEKIKVDPNLPLK